MRYETYSWSSQNPLLNYFYLVATVPVLFLLVPVLLPVVSVLLLVVPVLILVLLRALVFSLILAI